MKFKHVIISLGIAAVLGLGVGAGLKAAEVKEAQATTYRAQAGFAANDTIYVQPKAKWVEASAKFAIYLGTTDDSNQSWSPWLSEKTADGNFFYKLPSDFSYTVTKVVVARFDPEAAAPAWENWGQTKDLVVGSDSFDADHNCVWLPDKVEKGGGFFAYDENVYTLTVGANSQKMLLNPGNAGEVYARISAAAGDTLSVSYNGTPGVVYPNTKASNNLTAAYKIKVAATVDVYLAKDGWSTWVTGYAPSSTKLQDFCDAILAADCNAAGLAGVGESEAFTNLEAADKTAFNAATVKLGNDVSYASVVEEAATRYAHLINKGATPLSGITVSPAHALLTPVANNNSSTTLTIVIAATAAISLLAVAGFFFIRKRKESK